MLCHLTLPVASLFALLPQAIKSQKITKKIWTSIEDLDASKEGTEVTIRGHLQASRAMGKGVFAVIRSSLYTVQTVCFEREDIPKEMVGFIGKVSNESIVDVTGVVSCPKDKVEKCTQKDVEIQVREGRLERKQHTVHQCSRKERSDEFETII